MERDNLSIPAAVETAERLAYIAGLRELADFFEQHPNLPTPWNCNHLVPIKTKAALVAIARTPGMHWQKDWSSTDYFSLKAEFTGRHQYDVFVQRGEICRREVLGTKLEPAQPERLVEDFRWICDEPSLLADGGEPAAEARDDAERAQ